MNAERRKAIEQTISSLKMAEKALDAIFEKIETGVVEQLELAVTEAAEKMDEIYSEEEEALANLSESLQNGEQGEAMQEALEYLEGAKEKTDSLAEKLEEFRDCISAVSDAWEEIYESLQSAKGG